MFINPPLLLVLFIHSCFDPPCFSLSCSARGTIKLVICGPGGGGEQGQRGVPPCGTNTAWEGDFCWEKGKGREWEKKIKYL